MVLNLLTSTGKLNCQLYVEAWCLIFKFCCATYWHFHSKMLVTVPKWYICKKNTLISTKRCRNTKIFLKISMIKNPAPLTYNKSFWLRHDDLSYNCFLRYYSNRIVAIEKKRKKQPKKRTRYSTKQSLPYSLIWSPYNLQTYLDKKLFRVTVSGDQNVKKDGENLQSKLTNHKMTKFPERSEVCLFSLQEALCFYLNLIGLFIKKVWHPLFSINMFIGSFFFISIRFK